MASANPSRRVGAAVAYPPLRDMSADQRRELHGALLEADVFEDLPSKWQAAILEAEANQPRLGALGYGAALETGNLTILRAAARRRRPSRL